MLGPDRGTYVTAVDKFSHKKKYKKNLPAFEDRQQCLIGNRVISTTEQLTEENYRDEPNTVHEL